MVTCFDCSTFWIITHQPFVLTTSSNPPPTARADQEFGRRLSTTLLPSGQGERRSSARRTTVVYEESLSTLPQNTSAETEDSIAAEVYALTD